MAPLPRRLVPLRDSATLLLLPSLVAASSQSQSRLREIHAHLLVSGRLASPSHHADFVASLASSSHLSYARLLLPQRPATLLAHNGLLRALARGPCPGLAFAAFRELPLAPDHYSFTFLVRAATSLAAAASATPVPTDVAVNLLAGSVHAAAFQHGHATDPHVQSGAVSMYAAVGDVGAVRAAFAEIVSPDVVCVTAMLGALSAGGDVDTARELFDGMPQRDHVAWNAMLTGYVRVGRSREALGLFDEMQKAGVAVSEVTLVSVLTACAQMGALERGMWVHSYVCSRGMRVSVTLGTALVDMYSKCGVVTMAMEVFETMRERNIYTWTSALSGLAMNGMGEECLELFKRMESAGMEPNGVTFVAVLRGCSVAGAIEVDGKVHEFFVGSKSHPRYKDIQTMLAEMSHRLRLQGYAANTKEVLFDIEEEEKEGAISLHSEKLALAFGLITLPEDTVIRIVKNLRVCKDCHDYTKLISKVFDREIVMRDRNSKVVAFEYSNARLHA
ncbi:hypothetical protein ZWY2020_004680 [Hordeum vulgare]|nr:hypothetical protein ZWY2020_004680 [Hordeum vulgare]